VSSLLELVEAEAVCPNCERAGTSRWTQDQSMPAGTQFPGHFVRHFVCECRCHWSQFLGPAVERLSA
jgi:hypothetical protein